MHARACVAPKLSIGWSCSRAHTASFIPPIPRSLLCLPHSLTHCISPADWGISTSTDWDSLDSSARGLCVKSPAIPLPGSFSHGLWCSLCGWEVADVDVRVISWTRGEQETVKETGSLAGSPDWCLFGPGGMGCTTSAVVFDGLRTVLERNCSGYICKEAAEPTGPSEAERALSRRESRVLPTPRILKVCVCLCVCALSLTQYSSFLFFYQQKQHNCLCIEQKSIWKKKAYIIYSFFLNHYNVKCLKDTVTNLIFIDLSNHPTHTFFV